MTQYLCKVILVMDAKDEDASDHAVFHMLQDQIRRRNSGSRLLEWVFDSGDRMTASVKPIKPIRSIVGGGSTVLNKIEEEYDRAVAVRSLEKTDE